ncbi:SURF1 family protein [Nocardioides sp. CER19]|uniref:SURF1 family cytochrome oxidase biogenesis protein n=1 Tax=Nocardioides sp. CER19 TaxID=3038538 RepID=UPI00244C0F14|nr:SURF1 family protein [Nocardioides sp. CER19]MDH2415759.1 SURF1 family protein [Nocardioides sp. CER19]
MRSLRFLLSRRWALFALAVVVVAWGTWWLGQWQFHRLHDRKADNRIVETNEIRSADPIDDVLTVGMGAAKDDEWRLVTVTGTYDTAHTITWRYRSDDDGAPGVDVVVPLVTDAGNAVVVDRGFLQTDADDKRPDVPAPPSGRVTITGYVRVDGSGSSTRVDDLSTRALSSRTVGAAIGTPVYGGWLALHSEDPKPAQALEPMSLPDLGNGPHFFYGLQWWFFGILAVFGFFYLLYDEWRTGKGDELAADRRRAKQDRSNARAAKSSRKQAVREAYKAAYEKERAGRD